jgi:hypothetical protein
VRDNSRAKCAFFALSVTIMVGLYFRNLDIFKIILKILQDFEKNASIGKVTTRSL